MGGEWLLFLVLLTTTTTTKAQCMCEEDVIDCSEREFAVLPNVPEDCLKFTKLNISFNILPEAIIDVNTFGDNITEIYLTQNAPLKSISLSSTNVELLDISWNPNVKNINIKREIALRKLFANNNTLTDMSFLPEEGYCFLTTLEVNKNNINDLTNVTRCKNITHLSASHNDIKTLPDLHNLVNLTILDLSDNNVEVLEEGVFVGLQLLQTLTLASNKIHSIADGAFGNNTSLEYLDLADNDLTSINNSMFAELLELRYLDVSENKIASVEEGCFKKLRHLSTVNLDRNMLTTLPTLDLSDNDTLKQMNETMTNEPGDHRLTVLLGNNSIEGTDDALRVLVKINGTNGIIVLEDPVTLSCVNITHGRVLYILCLKNPYVGDLHWLDAATSSTAAPTTTVTSLVDTNATKLDCDVNNENCTVNGTVVTAIFSHRFYLTPLQYSFLGFLLLTLIVLIIVNIIVGDPVVDDRWWEEKVPGDRPVT